MKVILDVTHFGKEHKIYAAKDGEEGPQLEDLKQTATVDIDPTKERDGAFFRRIDTSFKGEKPGESHHVYTQEGQLKVDDNQAVERLGQKFDGIRIFPFHTLRELTKERK